jgi:serine protease Do
MKCVSLARRYMLPGLITLAVVFGGQGCALLSTSGALGTDSGLTGTTVNGSVPSVRSTSPAAVTQVVLTMPELAPLIEAVRPSVVAITTTYTEYIFRRTIAQEGAGSGWIMDSDGLIVTNNHVVEGADSITVMLADGTSHRATLMSADSNNDLAIIKIEAHNLAALEIGNSSALRVGDWVVALGNSLGMGTSATLGIVSALGISLSISYDETLDGMIQTDAAINPGNSGGPLVNLLGQVIGINSVKVAQVGVEGMGYAISINKAKPVIDQMASRS